jgi:hypothetical protein
MSVSREFQPLLEPGIENLLDPLDEPLLTDFGKQTA